MLYAPGYLHIRGVREPRGIRLVSYDPLIDEPVQNCGVAFCFSIHKHLVPAERAYFAQQDNVALHASRDLIQQLLTSRTHRRERQQRSGQHVAAMVAH